MTGNRHYHEQTRSPHWIDPRERGLHHGPAHQPPQPRLAESNNLATRIAQIEVHLWYATQDRYRAEQEGIARGLDNAGKIATLADRIQALEGHHTVSTAFWVWTPKLLAYAGAILIFALVISGKMTIEQARTFLPVLGLPSG